MSSRGGGKKEGMRKETKTPLGVQHDHVNVGVSTHLEQILRRDCVATKQRQSLSRPFFLLAI